MDILSNSFYQRPTVLVARDLIGKILVRELDGVQLRGIIVETEAYGAQDDPASHAYKKETARNQPMFGPVGHSYVYFTYGVHHCLNIVARDAQARAGAVLIRSIIPIAGIEQMQQLRNTTVLKNLANGPGKLTQALSLAREQNHINMTQSGILYVQDAKTILDTDINCTSRIGISSAQDKLWRFVLNKK